MNWGVLFSVVFLLAVSCFLIADTIKLIAKSYKYNYAFYLDDLRNPDDEFYNYCKSNNLEPVILRSSVEAELAVGQFGFPTYISLDHDLGGEDTSMVFLKWLNSVFPNNAPPGYRIHSANPIGSANMDSYLQSWKKSLE